MRLKQGRQGISLVEVLVVIAIIALIIALLLPAIQVARERARMSQCANNLRQIGLGCQSHDSAYGYFPTGGWTYEWVGDPDRGFSKRQPGGWIYNLLPFVEEQNLRDTGKGLDDSEKRAALSTLTTTPLSLFNCPSRRAAVAFERSNMHVVLANADGAPVNGRSDYAANAGDEHIWIPRGPETLEDSDSGKFTWDPRLERQTGVCFIRSKTKFRHLRDGASKTYLVGEKHLPVADYATGKNNGDDQSMFQGHDYDTMRWTELKVTLEWAGLNSDDNMPVQDSDERTTSFLNFGSAHSAGWYACLADGSTKLVSYEVDPEIHRRAGNRQDGS